MNSPVPLTTGRTRPPVRVQLASNWLEIFAIPIAAALMEAQPMFLLLQFFAVDYFNAGGQVPPTIIIAFVLLVFHWWALWNNARKFQSHPVLGIIFNLFYILLVFVLLILSDPALLNASLLFILMLILTGWSWKRGQNYARADMLEDRLRLAFRVNLVGLLLVLPFALFDLLNGVTTLNSTLLSSFPLFFLSGMLALSFARLSAFRQEQARNPVNVRKAGTNTWAILLAGTWGALVFLSVLLEGLPVQALRVLFTPLWYLIGLLLYLSSFIWQFLASFVGKIPWPGNQSRRSGFPRVSAQPSYQHFLYQTTHQAPYVQTILEIVAVVLVLAVITLLVLRRKKKTIPVDEEIRESLDKSAILRERRVERQQSRLSLPLESLDPASARGRYRAFLSVMAEHDARWRRRADETPAEYQKRLLVLVEQLPPPEDQDMPSDRAILEKLTRAYRYERYGARQLTAEDRNYLARWVPWLTRRLGRS